MAYNTLNYNLSRSFPMQTHFPSPSNAPYPNMGTLELTTNQIDNNLTWIISAIPLMFGLCASGIHAHTGMDAYILHNSLIFYCQVFVLQLSSLRSLLKQILGSSAYWISDLDISNGRALDSNSFLSSNGRALETNTFLFSWEFYWTLR